MRVSNVINEDVVEEVLKCHFDENELLIVLKLL